MPTERPRLTITETDDVAEAIAVAALRWPEYARGASCCCALSNRGVESSSAIALRRPSGGGRPSGRRAAPSTGVYEPGYLERLRDDWPA